MIDTRIIAGIEIDMSQQGESIPVRKVMAVRSHPDNSGLVWVGFGRKATEGECWPLNIGDGVPVGEAGFSGITNLDEIHCVFKNAGDKVTVLYEA